METKSRLITATSVPLRVLTGHCRRLMAWIARAQKRAPVCRN